MICRLAMCRITICRLKSEFLTDLTKNLSKNCQKYHKKRKMMPDSRPGVARCSLCSQTFGRPLLFYCWSLRVIKNVVSVVKNDVLANRTRHKFLTDFQKLGDLSKIPFGTFFGTNVFGKPHGSHFFKTAYGRLILKLRALS